MKKFWLFLSGLLLLLLMFTALFFAGAIFDVGQKINIETYFFQPEENYIKRPGTPLSPQDFGMQNMRDLLIQRYLTEYFYVIPNTDDITQRIEGRGALPKLSTEAVFEKWVKDIAPQIQSMAEKNMLRTVEVLGVNQAPKSPNYLQVEYELKTWGKSNDFSVAPETERGVAYMQIEFKPEQKIEIGKKSATDFLENGGDPIAIFDFRVDDLGMY